MASPTTQQPNNNIQTVDRRSYNQIQVDDYLETVETRDNLDDGLAISTAEFRGDQPTEFI